jgi:hypothetical protein
VPPDQVVKRRLGPDKTFYQLKQTGSLGLSGSDTPSPGWRRIYLKGKFAMPRGRIQILPPQYKASIQPRTDEERILAFCNELAHLRAEIKRLEGLIAFKDEKLVDTARFFEDVLRENKPQSVDHIKRLISQLKGAADRYRGGLE